MQENAFPSPHGVYLSSNERDVVVCLECSKMVAAAESSFVALGSHMMANPKLGQLVQVWYAKRYAHTMPLHGKIGKVVIVSKGKPRNHGVEVNGTMYAIPCGNLRKVHDTE
jgi:hypothetical protein